MRSEYRIGFSPCPNDTFIFDGWINGHTDRSRARYTPVIADVEELNRMALKGELEITKLSFHAFAHLRDKYQLLDHGSALGKGCGPLLIAKSHIPQQRIKDLKIAVPGKFTTANFLLSHAFPEHTNREETLFSDIENNVITGKVDAGVIIHENRFTYESKGLVKLLDLGELWEQNTGLPIPLGGIAVKRDLHRHEKLKLNNLMKRSIIYAYRNRKKMSPFIKEHAQEMDDKVMRQHINLYVNNYTTNLGQEGKMAISRFMELGEKSKIFPKGSKDIFL